MSMSEELRRKLKDARVERGPSLDHDIALKTGVSEPTQRRFRKGGGLREDVAFKLATYFGYPRDRAIAIAEDCAKGLGQRTA